ncbi:MAG: hypothetical protein IKQ70_16225 [Bacteroidales bacterium]|nr:hypothetical protein [Bacteroidales bacterium]
MKENGPSFDYNTMRYIGQNVGMTSDMPDDYIIKTTIKVENIHIIFSLTRVI